MPDETDAKKILTASPWRTGGDYQDTFVKQLSWLRIVHSRDTRHCALLVVHATKEEEEEVIIMHFCLCVLIDVRLLILSLQLPHSLRMSSLVLKLSTDFVCCSVLRRCIY